MTLAEFLLARIGEDEKLAQAAGGESWHVNSESYPESISTGDPTWRDVVAGGRWGGEARIFDTDEDALHIARWSPARALAECDAKRRIIDLHQPTTHPVLPPECEWCGPDTALDLDEQWPCLHLKLFALPYADHPDYREEWKP